MARVRDRALCRMRGCRRRRRCCVIVMRSVVRLRGSCVSRCWRMWRGLVRRLRRRWGGGVRGWSVWLCEDISPPGIYEEDLVRNSLLCEHGVRDAWTRCMHCHLKAVHYAFCLPYANKREKNRTCDFIPQNSNGDCGCRPFMGHGGRA